MAVVYSPPRRLSTATTGTGSSRAGGAGDPRTLGANVRRLSPAFYDRRRLMIHVLSGIDMAIHGAAETLQPASTWLPPGLRHSCPNIR